MKKKKIKYLIWCETQDIGFENNITFDQFLDSYAFSLKEAKKLVKEKNKNDGLGSGHLTHYYYDRLKEYEK